MDKAPGPLMINNHDNNNMMHVHSKLYVVQEAKTIVRM